MPALPNLSNTFQTHRTLLASAGLAAALLVAIALGHDDTRVVQLMALAAPALVWMVWPVRSQRAHRLRTVLLWCWAMGFALDGILRAYLMGSYGAAPDSSLVLAAAANTNTRESGEYLAMHWRTAVVWGCALVAAGCAFAHCLRRGARGPDAWPRWAVGVLVVALLAGSIGYLAKSWRRLHPVVFWAQWGQSVHTLRASWTDLKHEREAALARAGQAQPTVAQAGPATLVLVITDSINRDNMALYGYQRATTPRLLAHKAQLGEQMRVMRNAWSVDASTLPSLNNMLNFGEPGRPDAQHLLALARAAGYKTWWMSNHDDIAIEQQHARLADVVEMVNRVPGRAGASLDGELLDCLQEALEDPAERKLIVVHFMGAHPHYGLRYPPGANPFDDAPDAVEDGLEDSGRPAWVRRYRQEYDAAILYNDFVVAETLHLARSAGRPGGYRSWMYLSDHGQEVGHGSDHAGHSPQTASGYRIPALLWRNDAPAPAGPETNPFRADWAAWTMADLLHLRWPGRRPERNALDLAYQWVPPVLPMAVPSFTD